MCIDDKIISEKMPSDVYNMIQDHMDNNSQVWSDVGKSVVNLLNEAKDRERIVDGVYDCADMLERCPEQVMLCLLVDTDDATHDVTVDIEHTLIQAYCWENGVRVLKVRNKDGLKKLLFNTVYRGIQRSSKIEQSCICIKYPEVWNHMDDWERVVRFCDWAGENDVINSVSVPLPD